MLGIKLRLKLIAVAAALAISGCAGQTDVREPLSWPVATAENKPWSRWWWLGSAVDQENLSSLLQQYHDAGIGGVEICPIYGAKGAEDRFIDFLSPKWVDMLAVTTNQAQRLDMRIDMTTGTGWPFGGPDVPVEQASSTLVMQAFPVAGGAKFAEKLPEGRIQCVRAVSDKGEQVDLTVKVKASDLDWTAPDGTWKLYVIGNIGPAQKVKRAGPGGEGNVLDPYSTASLDRYLAPFDKAFNNYTAPRPRSQFHDSFEYYDASWTPEFFREFLARRGYDLRSQLPAFFGDAPPDIVARVKSDYRETIFELHLAYIKRWTAWCHSQGMLSRNQAHGSPGNLIDFYSATDIPETEMIFSFDERNMPIHRMSASAAHLNGRQLASAESFTWLGEHFQVSLAQVKHAADFFFVNGVNHILFHGIPYSPKDAPWPGWLFYASVNFGPNGGLWHDLPEFNAYVTRCQSILQAGRPSNDLLLYFPIHDIIFQKPEGLVTPLTIKGESWLWNTDFQATATHLAAKGFSYDEISDRLLAGASVADGQITLGGNKYQAIVIPPCKIMPDTTMAKLLELAKAGATIIFQDDVLPGDVPGLGGLDGRRMQLRHDRDALQPLLATFPGGQGGLEGLDSRLKYAGVIREPMTELGLKFIRRERPDGFDYFIVNWESPDAKTVDGWVTLGTPAQSAVILDPLTGDRAGVAQVRLHGTAQMKPDLSKIEQSEIRLQLRPGESRIVRTFTRRDVSGQPWTNYAAATDGSAITGTWNVKFIEGGPALPREFTTAALASWTSQDDPEAKRFAGTARYTIEFDRPSGDAAQWLLDLGKVCESARVKLNGKSAGTAWSTPFTLPVGSLLKPGKNTLEVEVTNFAANRVADMDRQGVNWKYFYEINFVGVDYKPFDASKWPLKDSGLIGPVRLIPMKAE